MAINGSRSVFPEGVDVFTELYDLPFDKINQATRLTELKGKATLTNDEQNEILSLTNSLKEYMITPETFNKFQDALVAVQIFFNDNVQGYIENKQAIWDSYINDFKAVGAWKTGTAYRFQNMVTDAQGNLFICKKSHTASSTITTVNTTYWQQASARGEKGDTGLNALYKGAWSSATAYTIGDVVRYGRTTTSDGLDYIALQAGTNQNPSTESAYWGIYSKLFVGTERPNGAGEGLHFIKLV